MNKFYNNSNLKITLLSLVGTGLCFSVSIGNIILIVTVVYTLLFTKKSFNRLKSVALGYPLFFFLITVISAVYSKDRAEGIRHLDLMLLMVVIVIPFLSQNLRLSNVKKVINTFFYSITLATFILLGENMIKYLSGQSLSQITFHGFTRLYDQHPVYYSIYISFALFSQLTIYKIKFNNKVLEISTILILVFGLLMCASKAIIVFSAFVFGISALLLLNNIRQKIYTSISVFIFVSLSYSLPFLNNRFSEGLTFSNEILAFKPTNDFTKKKLFTYDEKENISDLEIRYIFGKIMLYHFFSDDKLLFGYGQGDIQNYTDYYNFSYHLGPKWYEDYNVHNQYIHILITYGIFVLFIFLGYLVFSFYIAIINSNYLYLFFLLICSFVFLFEVTLVRNKGIIFFYFFNTLFLAHYLNFEDSNTRNKGYTKFSRWF